MCTNKHITIVLVYTIQVYIICNMYIICGLYYYMGKNTQNSSSSSSSPHPELPPTLRSDILLMSIMTGEEGKRQDKQLLSDIILMTVTELKELSRRPQVKGLLADISLQMKDDRQRENSWKL